MSALVLVPSQYMQWSIAEVTTWLASINLHHLIPNFERMQIDGVKLVSLNDQDLRLKLRITKPAEVMAVKGAISKLQEDAHLAAEPKRRVSSNKLGPGQGPARERSGSGGREERKATASHSRTVPRDMHSRGNTYSMDVKAPRLTQGSAAELIEQSKYSGWIRKQGGSYKNWKKRYLILRHGCLYYFKDETANSAKGSFVLSGYQTEVCKEPEIVKNRRYSLKLTPMNPQVRTYYISVGSQRELEGWKKAIDEEISSVTRRPTDMRHNTVYSTSATAGGLVQPAMFDDDDDEDDNEDPYEPVPEENDDDSDHNYDDPQQIYDKPENVLSSEDDEDPYSKIEEALSGRSSKPIVPDRSEISLFTSPPSSSFPSSKTPMPVPVASSVAGSLASSVSREEAAEVEDTYLPIVSVGPASNPAAAQPDLTRSNHSPVHNDSVSRLPSGGHDADDYDNDENLQNSNSDDDDDDNEGGYYIMFRRPEEIMPTCCVFDRLDRHEADRMLREKGMDGMYLIRAGSHAGAEKVLSVWHTDKCRHYRLFKDENQSYSLTQGQSFRTIPELLQYYTLQQKLPRSDYYLVNPFNPLDH